jgi:beta-lactamase regulating signal transducer with metallopeptidase domain/flagellar basal body-associated protein FliL
MLPTMHQFLSEIAREDNQVLLSATRALVAPSVALGIAWGASKMMRRSSATRRHFVLTLGVAAALALPILQRSITPWGLISVPTEMTRLGLPEPVLHAASNGITQPADSLNLSIVPNAPPTPETSLVNKIVNISDAAMLLWILGGVILLGRLFLAIIAARRLVSDGIPFNHPDLTAALTGARATTGVGRDIGVVTTARTSVPLLWGVFTPTIILPDDAISWGGATLRDVLTHELAHARRFDCAVRVLARLARAIYWPSPFAWLVTTELDRAAEEAADDTVLGGGSTPSTYASLLVDTARVAQLGLPRTAVVAPMARPTDLKDRIHAVLDATRSRDTLSMRWIGGSLAALALVVAPLAFISPVKANSSQSLSTGVDSVVNAERVAEPVHLETTLKIVRALNVGRSPRSAFDTCVRVIGALRSIHDTDVTSAYPWDGVKCASALPDQPSSAGVRLVPAARGVSSEAALRAQRAYGAIVRNARLATIRLRNASYDPRKLARVDIDSAVASGAFSRMFGGVGQYPNEFVEAAVSDSAFVPMRDSAAVFVEALQDSTQILHAFDTTLIAGSRGRGARLRIDSLSGWGRDTVPDELKALVMELGEEQKQLRALRKNLTDDHPNVVQQAALVERLRSRIIDTTLNASASSLSRRLGDSRMVVRPDTAERDSVGPVFSISNVLINPRDEVGPGETRHLEVSIAFELSGGETYLKFMRRSAILTDTLITLYSAHTATELSNPKIRGSLKDKMLAIARSLAGNNVKRASYTQYVLK